MSYAFEALPRGFSDLVGEEAAQGVWAESMFRSVTRSFGFAPVTVAPVGYAETFEQFGSAATGRIFAFEDLSGRRLALTADSLVAVLRALAGSGRLTGGASALGAACVPIARYRRKRHRGWSQAVAVICNEADELAADLTLLRLWAELFEVLGPAAGGRLEYCDYGVLDAIAADEGLSPAAARNALHHRRRGPAPEAGEPRAAEPAPPSPAGFLRRLDRLSELCRGLPPREAPDRVAAAEPVTGERMAHLRTVLAIAHELGVRVEFALDWEHAPEYQAGLCFLARTGDGRTLGDGGGYHHMVRTLDIGLSSCWSTSASVNLLAELGPVPDAECVHLMRMPSADLRTFMAVARRLRGAGYDVLEHWQPRRLGRQLRRVPARPSQWFALVGEKETASGRLTLQNAAATGVTRDLDLNPV
ncbi:ATP phosphoribosyltransferase regulatory subunit [Streptomyces goshikiensis]|uniref:ATP phosphoribosyltransferase regulatory subunit n=1 Tax=Streptomyces goshikiensis TaxID=1942 RepID=UPI002E0F299C|nr:ATP phosphoribosyltransferase regulatory subunit [Streptomyces goshikiensis]